MVHVLERVRVEKLGLHYPEEVLHHGIVQAVALAAHALDDFVIFQRLLVDCVLVVPPLIRVQNQPLPNTLFGVCPVQHVHYHLQVRVVRDCVADYFAVVHVEYRRQVALVRSDVYLRHVGCPLPVGRLRVEVPLEPVRRSLADLSLVGAVLAALAHVLQAFFLHKSVDRLVVNDVALVPELGNDAAVAVAALVLGVYGLDPAAFVGVAVPPLLEVVVVCGAGQPACLQEMFQGVLGAQFVDDLGPIPNIPALSSWSRAFIFFK